MSRRSWLIARLLLVSSLTIWFAPGTAFAATATPTWHSPQRIDTNSTGLYLVACAGTTFCMAVDSGNDAVGYTGSTWTTGPVIDSYGVTALACASTTLCVSGDIQGYVRRFNGTGWGPRVDLSSRYNPIGGYLDAVSCPSTSFCMAGDNSGHSYVSTDGAHTWGAPVDAPVYDLAALSCASATLCVGSDIYGRVSVFDGTAGGAATAENFATAVACAGTACVALSADVGRSVERYDGTAWHELPVPGSSGLTTIACVSASRCFAADVDGSISRFDGTSWATPTDVFADAVSAIGCDQAGLCVALDRSVDASINTDGQAWSTPQAVQQTGGALVSISCPSVTMCMAVDTAGNAVSYHAPTWDAPVPVTGGEQFVSVSCVSATFCDALDDQGEVRTYDGSAWSEPQPAADPNDFPTSIACSTTTFCMVGTQDGVIYHFTGTRWLSYGNLQQSGTSDLACLPHKVCFAAGASILEFDGTTWGRPRYLGTSYVTRVSCASATSCVALDSRSNVHTYTDGSWARPVDSGLHGATDISCQTSGTCVIVDSKGYATVGQGSAWSAPTLIDPAGGGEAAWISAVSCTRTGPCTAVSLRGEAIAYS
jgi:hypothetical protein